jgi:hypothetical protein
MGQKRTPIARFSYTRSIVIRQVFGWILSVHFLPAPNSVDSGNPPLLPVANAWHNELGDFHRLRDRNESP